MAGKPNKDSKPKINYATSTDCESCASRCVAGTRYLSNFSAKGMGKGVRCNK